MLIELHTLTSHAPGNLNRDDLGRPKSAVFGGVQRARISSQAIKRSIRTSNHLEEILRDRLSTRSRQVPQLIFDDLKKELNLDDSNDSRLKTLCSSFTEMIGKPDKNPLHTKQIVFLTKNEIERAKRHIRELLDSDNKLGKKDLEEIKANGAVAIGLNRNPGDGVDMALFGRMTTDDANSFAGVDAAMQVAHAISTHTVVPEVDWFTAVDDIVTGESETGSAHLGETEFNAATFYKYFSCNLPLLVRNMSDDRDAAVDALAAVLDASCRVTPSGKQNSFASHSLADSALLVVRNERVPVSLANAFESPVSSNEKGFLTESRNRMASHYSDLREGYGFTDRTLFYATSSDARDTMKAVLPAGTEIFTSLGAMFDRMKELAREMN